MPAIQFLGEDAELEAAIARIASQKGYAFRHNLEEEDLLKTISHRQPSLIIIAPARDQRWRVVKVAANIRTIIQHIPIMLINDQSSEAQVLAALKLGVSDYFKNPVSLPEFIQSLEGLVSPQSDRPIPVDMALPGQAVETVTLVGNSQAMRTIREQLEQVADTDSTVLITGETGTGKDLMALLIHQGSKRRHRPMVYINCAALPDSLVEGELFGFEKGAFTGAHAFYEGKLKLAEGGTVFFDEIGDMSLSAQAKLLQVIESKEIFRLRGRRQVTLALTTFPSDWTSACRMINPCVRFQDPGALSGIMLFLRCYPDLLHQLINLFTIIRAKQS
jgi:DNA-binding NtrC family response regulator